MAGPHNCYSPRCNPLLTGEDELARAPTKGSGTPTYIFAISRTLSPAPAPISASAPASTDKLFKQFMKAYLDA